jgi:hypothetical protein
MRGKPYLSVVATSRNDGHGGDILKRMQIFVRGLIDQANRHRLPVELVIVEWNPPPDLPLLQSLLPRPGKDDQLELRYIEVPSDIHDSYRLSPNLPLFQMTAKNVGIRRAKGEFILCTNIDLLFSDALFRRLTAGNLRKDTYYRANRCDVVDGIDPGWDIGTQLEWCSRHIIRRLGRDMRFRNCNLEQFGLSEKPWFKKWLFDKIAIGINYYWPPEKRQYYLIDSFACGDFTLMASDAWQEIRGYLELDLYSLHIDTLGLIAAASLGYKQHVFPRDACTYHIDHPSGWSSMGPLEKIRFLEKRPGIDYGLVFETGLSVLKEKTALNLNRDDWGFADHDFREYCFPE